MKLHIYVNYKETCREAFQFYEKNLGGKIMSITTFGEMPHAAEMAKGRENKIVHARMEIGGMILMGADVPIAEPMRSAYLALTFDTAADAERVYALLADGGEVFAKIQQTPFASRYAMLRDRFGANWMLLHQEAQ